MIDNASLATAVVGLEAVRREQELYDSLVPQARRGASRSSTTRSSRRHAAARAGQRSG
jgi:hypothetical protein